MTTMLMTLAGAVLMSLGIQAAAEQGTPPPPPGVAVTVEALPDRARDALESRWPDWEVAPADEAANGACAGGPASLGLVVQYDIDSDNRADYALAVQTGSEVRLVALLDRPWNFVVFDLEKLGERAAAGVLHVAERGRKYRPAGSPIDEYFANNTLILHRCSGPPIAYVWKGLALVAVPLTGGPQAAAGVPTGPSGPPAQAPSVLRPAPRRPGR